MKIHKLTINNIGKIENAIIELNKSLNLFYGDIMTGKTTILNAIKLCFGGSFPNDLITHGKDKGFVKLEFDDSSITREFVRNGENTVKAKPILFIKDNQVVNKPVDALKKFINPFLLDQEYIIRMSELDRKKFFCDLFDIDLTDLKNQELGLNHASKELRNFIKVMGDINPVKMEKPDIDSLYSIRKEIENNACEIIDKSNAEADIIENKNNAHENRKVIVKNKKVRVSKINIEIDKLLQEKKQDIESIKINEIWLKNNHLQSVERPSLYFMQNFLKEIDEKISNAKAEQVRYENYLTDVEKLTSKHELEQKLKDSTRELKEVREEKLKRLSAIAKNSNVSGLEFTEDGSFKFEGTSAGMLSTSQLMTLSSLLVKLYPDSVGIELIDKGESLGRRIFEFVERAEQEKRTICATIVGDKPALVPENIGVFVVDDGVVKNGE